MEIKPEHLVYIGDVMSNFDHEIDREVEKKLRTGDYYADYPGWNFHGVVWFDGKFKCMIRCYCSHVATLVAETLEEIMEEASIRWGAA